MNTKESEPPTLPNTQGMSYDPSSDSYSATFDPADESISQLIIRIIARARGHDPTDGWVPLYDHIDPDALDALFRPRPDGTPRVYGRVEFEFDGYWVSIHSGGWLMVCQRP